MARSRSQRGAAARRMIIINHRGGSGNASDGVGNFTGFVSSVDGAKPDLSFSVVNGVAQAPVPKLNRDWEFFDYALGAIGTLSAGYGWNGAAAFPTPFATRASDDFFDSYASGAVLGADLNGGSGWTGAPVLSDVFVQRVGEEQFETYADGGVTGPDLSGGSGWVGAPVIAAY